MAYLKIHIPSSFPVVLLLFVMACSQVGTTQTMGLYFEDISKSLGTTSTEIGVALGLFTAFSCFPAPIIVAIYRLKSTRRVILVLGSILAPLGVICTSFATNNFLLGFFLSISGLGYCMLTMVTTIVLDLQSSRTNFNLRYAIGMSGFGLGMLLLPFVAEILLDAYSWRGGILVLGGLFTNVIPCAMAVGQPSRNNETIVKYKELINPAESHSSFLVEQDETLPLLHRMSLFKCFHGDRSWKVSSKTSNATGFRIFMYSYGQLKTSLKCILTTIRGSDFYMDPVLNLLFVTSLVNGVLYDGWYAFLVPYVLQRYSIRNTILVNLYASIGTFLARPLSGALSNCLTKPIVLYMGAAVLNTSAILCGLFLKQYSMMALTTCLTAFGVASMSVVGPLVIRERASPGIFDIVYALHELFFGLGTFLGGYLSGLLGDIYSTYDATFMLLAGVNLVIFLLLLPAFFVKKPFNR